MSRPDGIAARLTQLGRPLPTTWAVPPDASIPATLVRVTGDTAWVSGHTPTDPDGRPCDTVGAVGAEQATDLVESREAMYGR